MKAAEGVEVAIGIVVGVGVRFGIVVGVVEGLGVVVGGIKVGVGKGIVDSSGVFLWELAVFGLFSRTNSLQ